MATTEERRQVLEMVAAGQITIDEATRLLEAVEGPAGQTTGGAGTGSDAVAPEGPVTLGKGRTLRVRVVENGKQKVNVRVPMGLAKLFLRIAGKEALKHEKMKDLDVEEIIRQAESGLTGKLVEVEDGDSLVEVYVD
jgi:hypothetical protein